MTEPDQQAREAAGQALTPALMHDLRTPLNQIIGYTEMLMEQAREAGDEGYVPDLAKVNAAGYRLLALLEAHFLAVRPPGAPAMAAGAHAETSAPDRRA